MNVELVNPALVLRLLSPGDTAQEKRDPKRAPTWVSALRALLAKKIRYRRTLRELRQLDGRELEDLGIAPADLGALAWRHANGVEAPARI